MPNELKPCRDRLIDLLNFVQCKAECCSALDGGRCGDLDHLDRCQMEAIADHLLANGVIVLPCKVGDTIYRIDIKPKKCSQFNVYTKNGYYCADELNCYLYGTPSCDCGEEAYMFTIPNADIKAIVCNMDKLGKTVFLTKEEAEKAIAERSERNDLFTE
ncbi:MAG: hypothetical protein IJ043_03325 [Clostridia bacterium]|nr:hypothetical protein [Clostridia bacterium]